jgi:hypothetical protein
MRAEASQDAALDPSRLLESEFARDLARGRWDIPFFATRFLGITPHPGQMRFWEAVLLRDHTGWQPRYLDIDLAAGNRAGKTLAVTVAHFHASFYKHGMRPPRVLSQRSMVQWNALPYEWYHFGIAQETSELAYIELTRLMQGIHEAQVDGCPLTNELGGPVCAWDKKYRGEYLWVRIHPVFGGANIHYRTTGEKAIGSLGKDMNGISYDEGGFDPYFDFVVSEVLHNRRLSTGGQMWIVGTATEGLTAFADHWYKGDPDAPDRKTDAISLRMSTRENVGYGIDPDMFDRLVAGMPADLIPQNIDGMFLEGKSSFFAQSAVDEMFTTELPEVQAALKGHHYIQGVDPAIRYDSTWSLVLDNTRVPAVGVLASHQTGRTTTPVIAALVTNNHNTYTGDGYRCTTGVDTTGMGGAMFREALPITVRSVEFGGTRGRKLKLLNNLKTAIEQRKLRFPRSGKWLTLRRQLLGYRLSDKNLQTDAVMALAVAWDMVRLNPPGTSSATLDYFGGTKRGVPSRTSIGPPAMNFGRRVVTYTSLRDMKTRGG